MPTTRPIKVPIVGDNKTDRAFRSVERDAKRLAGRLKGIGTALGIGTIGAGSFLALSKSVITADAQLAKMANRLKVSAGFMSELEFAVGRTSGQFPTMVTALQGAGRRIGEFIQGTGEASNALQTLGFTAEDLKGIGLERQFELILDRLRGITDENERLRIAQKIFDSEGVAVVELAGRFGELRDRARELGITLSEESAAKVLDADAAFRDLEATTKSVARELGLLVAGPLTAFASRVVGIQGAVNALSYDALLGEAATLRNSIAETIDDIQKEAEFGGRFFMKLSEERKAAIREELEAEQERLAAIEAELAARVKLKAFFAAPAPAAIAPPTPVGQAGTTDAERAADRELARQRARAARLREEIKTDIERAVSSIDEAKVLKSLGLITPEEFNKRIRQIAKIYQQGQKEIRKETTDTGGELEDVAARIAATWKNEFEGLGDVIGSIFDQLITDVLKAGLLELLGGIPGIGSLFGGKRAFGGGVDAGRLYQINEREPEFFIPSSGGRVVPLSQIGGAGGGGPSFTFNQSVNVAGGGDSDLVAELPGILDSHKQNTIASIAELMRQGRLQSRRG